MKHFLAIGMGVGLFGIAAINTACGEGATARFDDGGAENTGGAGTGAGGVPNGGRAGLGGAGPRGTSTKLDVLFVVDNSISMAEKQQALGATVPGLVSGFTDPSLGVLDLHIGVITSSLGAHGSENVCVGTAGDLRAEEGNDLGRLVGTRPRAASLGIASGFLAWTPSIPAAELVTGVQGLVTAAGEFGCGFEMTLESAYRFLSDPNPPLTIAKRACSAQNPNPCGFPEGRDDTLLAQRAAFLRADSVLAIVVLSDENDCSIRNSETYTWAAGSEYTLRQGSRACATNPNDVCCYSCLESQPPAGCTSDPTCGTPDPAADAAINLRCFEQKRRFGMDFLYPVARYVNAFSKARLCPTRVDLDPDQCGSATTTPNPLFPGGAGRDPSMVYVASIVGVPSEEVRADGTVNYAAVLGEPSPPGNAAPVAPTDALMIESVVPRTGTGPGGQALQPPSAGRLANPVNGHEWTNSRLQDLQYACIFALPEERDCAAIRAAGSTPEPGCDCWPGDESENKPLCQRADGTYGYIQFFGKAYPGARHLAVARALGGNAVVGSICAKNLTDPSRADFGYGSAITALAAAVGRSIQ